MTDYTPQSLPDRIYAALEAPIDQWDEAERMGLTHAQHKALRGILMDWFCEWIRDDFRVGPNDIRGLFADYGDKQDLADRIGEVINKRCRIIDGCYEDVVREVIAVMEDSQRTPGTVEVSREVDEIDAALEQEAE